MATIVFRNNHVNELEFFGTECDESKPKFQLVSKPFRFWLFVWRLLPIFVVFVALVQYVCHKTNFQSSLTFVRNGNEMLFDCHGNLFVIVCIYEQFLELDWISSCVVCVCECLTRTGRSHASKKICTVQQAVNNSCDNLMPLIRPYNSHHPKRNGSHFCLFLSLSLSSHGKCVSKTYKNFVTFLFVHTVSSVDEQWTHATLFFFTGFFFISQYCYNS